MKSHRPFRFHRRLRTFHRVASIIVAVPFFIVLTTGLLLATRNFNPYVQPPAVHGSRDLQVEFPRILESLKTAPTVNVHSWEDVSQIDIRPSSGEIRARTKRGDWEINIDAQSGAILNVAKRRVGWLTSLHEGAEFGALVRYGVFLPSSFCVLLLLLTGVYIYFAMRSQRKPARS